MGGLRRIARLAWAQRKTATVQAAIAPRSPFLLVFLKSTERSYTRLLILVQVVILLVLLRGRARRSRRARSCGLAWYVTTRARAGQHNPRLAGARSRIRPDASRGRRQTGIFSARSGSGTRAGCQR